MWWINMFHVQILVFELLFVWPLAKRKLFWVRLPLLAAAYLVLPSLVPVFHSALRIGWFTTWFLLCVLLSAALLSACFRVNMRQLVFVCCVGHTLQHMVHCLAEAVTHLFGLQREASQAVLLITMVLMVLGVFLFLRKRISVWESEDMNSRYLSVFALISSLVVYFLSYWTTSQERGTVGMWLFDFLACLLLLIILLDMFRFRRAEREQMLLLRVLRQEQEQHALSKATIDMINRKCHDLKHQISALRNMDQTQQEKSIAELEHAILIYDRFAKTGNDDLDIILAEKGLICEEKEIRLQCIADGAQLGFMSTEDLYALLGNALDNAIEATAQEKAPGRRIISVRVSAQGSLVSIHIENPCGKKPLLIDGLPQTTKADADYHGFGMKSMRYIVEKYSGGLRVDWEDGIFSVDMLFSPVGAKQEYNAQA